MKKIVIPVVVFVIVMIVAISTCSRSNKIILENDSVKTENIESLTKRIKLNVYMENSGSMDAYMCPGSDLKDAVFDYVSDLNAYSKNLNLFYINSEIIQYKGDLQSYIKDLTPESFAEAGGDRLNTDLRRIFELVMEKQENNTVTVFVSDCILDIPEDATDYFGNCQISMKNIFSKALKRNPYLGVMIMQLSSKFDGIWYCGKQKLTLRNEKRPYYIWVIGDNRLLAYLSKNVPVNDIFGGIKNYCAYSGKSDIPFEIPKKEYTVNRTDKIDVEILVDMTSSLQSGEIIKDINQYKSSNPSTTIKNITEITNVNSIYSHVVSIEINEPESVRGDKITITFSYPNTTLWIGKSNDTTGMTIRENIDKTTGIAYLIGGVAEAFKNSTDFGNVTFKVSSIDSQLEKKNKDK